MIALAIDTTHEFGSIALRGDSEGFSDEILLHEPAGFGAVLFAQIEVLLSRNDLGPGDIDLFAAAAGPGSFTGVRVGLTAAKALAEARRKPCFGVSNLAAMASFGSARFRAALLDARRGEVYGGVFGPQFAEETVASFPRWLAELPNEVEEFLAFDFHIFAPALAASRFAAARRTQTPRGISGAVAEIALERQRAGESSDPAELDANYVRRSDAEMLWKG